jgi:hypothetical protein
VAAERRDFEKAIGYQRQALAMDRALLGDAHANVGMDLVLVGIFLVSDGKVATAEAPRRQGVAVLREALGADHPATAGGLYGLGRYLAAARKFEEGELVARDVVRIHRARLSAGHWEIALAETLLGEILGGLGRDADAERLLVTGCDTVRENQPPGSRHRQDARDRLVRFLRVRGHHDRATAVPE